MKTLFRVDASEKIGMGHLMRCLTVAIALRKLGTESAFVVSDEKARGILEQKGLEVHQICIEDSGYDVKDVEEIKCIIKDVGADVIVVDSYAVTKEYLEGVGCSAKVVVFSCKEEKMPLDILINYNINCNQKKIVDVYHDEKTKVLLGSKFVPLREEFKNQKYVVNETVTNILVMTGGSDMHNFMGTFLEKLMNFGWDKTVQINCLVGKYNVHRAIVEESASKMRNVRLIEGTNDMASLLKKQDLIVSAGGTTMYEICAIGVPTILYSIADNQISESIYMSDIGAMEYVGCFGEDGFWERFIKKTNSLIVDLEKRKKQRLIMNELVDCKGAERIANAILELERV